MNVLQGLKHHDKANILMPYLTLSALKALHGKTDVSTYLFSDTATILNSIVSKSYRGMLRRQISVQFPPKRPL